MQDDLVKSSQLPRIPPWLSVSCCLVLSMMYVASLYIWNSKHDRNHPSTVKRRFCSVFVVMLIAPLFVYLFSTKELLERNSLAQLLGLRLQGIVAATTVPLALTALLFLGPISVHVHNGSIFAIFETDFWRSCFTNILWIRNLIVAPLSEEFVFRACMMPLVLQSFPPLVAIIVTPLFFGTAHIHHIAERLSVGMELSLAIAISCIQLTYTTLFGFYSAFLFVRTGHFVAPFVVHAFCNHMGFPDLGDLSKHCVVKRVTFRCCCVLGFIGWILLLPLATEPQLYGNSQTWTLQESQ